MKNSLFPHLGFLLFIFSCFYLTSRLHLSYEAEHESLNDTNLETDLYLRNVQHYMKEDVQERSSFHLQNAIESLRRLERDIDVNTGIEVENAIDELEEIHSKMSSNEFSEKDLDKVNQIFAKTLKVLTLAELRVSERYAESDKQELAKVALKYARLHLKNAIEYSKLPERQYDVQIYNEMDSLIHSPNQSPIEMSTKLDHMIAQIDELIHQK